MPKLEKNEVETRIIAALQVLESANKDTLKKAVPFTEREINDALLRLMAAGEVYKMGKTYRLCSRYQQTALTIEVNASAKIQITLC